MINSWSLSKDSNFYCESCSGVCAGFYYEAAFVALFAAAVWIVRKYKSKMMSE